MPSSSLGTEPSLVLSGRPGLVHDRLVKQHCPPNAFPTCSTTLVSRYGTGAPFPEAIPPAVAPDAAAPTSNEFSPYAQYDRKSKRSSNRTGRTTLTIRPAAGSKCRRCRWTHSAPGGRSTRHARCASTRGGGSRRRAASSSSPIPRAASSSSSSSPLSSSSSASGSNDRRTAIWRRSRRDSRTRPATSSSDSSEARRPFPFPPPFFPPFLLLRTLATASSTSAASSSSSRTLRSMAHDAHCTSDTRSAVENPPYSAASKSSRYSDGTGASGRDRQRKGALRTGRTWRHDAQRTAEPDQPSKGWRSVGAGGGRDDAAAAAGRPRAARVASTPRVGGSVPTEGSSSRFGPSVAAADRFGAKPSDASAGRSSCFFSSSRSSGNGSTAGPLDADAPLPLAGTGTVPAREAPADDDVAPPLAPSPAPLPAVVALPAPSLSRGSQRVHERHEELVRVLLLPRPRAHGPPRAASELGMAPRHAIQDAAGIAVPRRGRPPERGRREGEDRSSRPRAAAPRAAVGASQHVAQSLDDVVVVPPPLAAAAVRVAPRAFQVRHERLQRRQGLQDGVGVARLPSVLQPAHLRDERDVLLVVRRLVLLPPPSTVAAPRPRRRRRRGGGRGGRSLEPAEVQLQAGAELDQGRVPPRERSDAASQPVPREDVGGEEGEEVPRDASSSSADEVGRARPAPRSRACIAPPLATAQHYLREDVSADGRHDELLGDDEPRDREEDQRPDHVRGPARARDCDGVGVRERVGRPRWRTARRRRWFSLVLSSRCALSALATAASPSSGDCARGMVHVATVWRGAWELFFGSVES
ncbi:hypothetical protein ACHAWF_007724 [Thalassiosira exigua]